MNQQESKLHKKKFWRSYWSILATGLQCCCALLSLYWTSMLLCTIVTIGLQCCCALLSLLDFNAVVHYCHYWTSMLLCTIVTTGLQCCCALLSLLDFNAVVHYCHYWTSMLLCTIVTTGLQCCCALLSLSHLLNRSKWPGESRVFCIKIKCFSFVVSFEYENAFREIVWTCHTDSLYLILIIRTKL